MKTKSKIFFLILFLFFIFIPISSSYVRGAERDLNVSGQNGRDPAIVADYLKVKLGDFNDSTPGDTKRELNYIPGGRDLHSFENMGIVYHDSDTNTIIVHAEATFGFEVNAWTSCLIGDIYPKAEFDIIRDEMYFRFTTHKHEQYWWGKWRCLDHEALLEYEDAVDEKYYIHYREVDYGAIDNLHDFHGDIETKIWIDPGSKLSGKMDIFGHTFTVPKLEAKIQDLTIADMRGGECGSYKDRYTSAKTEKKYVKFTTLSGEYYAGETLKIVDWLNEKLIGNYTLINMTGEPTLGFHDKCIDLTFKGRDYVCTDENEMTFDLPVRLQPQVTTRRQYIHYNWGRVKWWDCCSKFKGVPVAGDRSIPRDLSVHVYNVFAHYDYEVKMDLYMDCQFTGEISESILEDPNLIISDRMWDETIWIDVPEYALPPADIPWWIWVLIACIVGVVLYVGYKYLETRKKPVQVIVGGQNK